MADRLTVNMGTPTRLTNSFRDLPVMDKVHLSRNLSSELIPDSQPLDAKFRFNSVMFSCTLPAWSDDRKNARKRKERERKKSLSKGKDRYTIVKGLAGGPDGISFESATKKKHFLRVRDNILIVEAYDDSEDYRKQSTFIPLQDMWFGGYVVFESLVEPAHFIRRCAEQLMLQKYENSPFFKEDASFKLARKRCIVCIKIGSRVWARVEKGCFLRGTVIAVDDMVHIQLENGNKISHKKLPPNTTSECAYVPDIIPHPLEIDVGTRVLARWFNRLDSYYPATITAVRRTYFNVKYDDGDKGSNNINEIRLLKQPEVEGGASIPSWSSLDGLPRVGGLCIDSSGEYSASEEISDGHDATNERWTSIKDHRPESPIDTGHETDTKEAHFGYENNLQYLTPNIQPLHAPVVRNVSQVSGGSTDSGYHDSACAGSTRQRRTGLWAELHSPGRTPAGKHSDKEMWDNEDTDALSDIETSNSTNYSTTHDLEFPDSFVSTNSAGLSAFNAEDNAISHASYSESNGGSNTSSVTTSYSTGSDSHGSYVTQNGTRSDVKGCPAPYPTDFAKTVKETKRTPITKHRRCPIHHHTKGGERSRVNKAAKNGGDGILTKESPSLVGLETVI